MRVGFSAETGQLIYSWDHCVQSLTTILTTEIGEAVQRRDFGAKHPDMIDRPQNLESVLDLYVSVVQAIEPRLSEGRQLGEPGFILTQASIDVATAGEVSLILSGVFFENGHLGDYSNPIPRTLSLPLAEALSGA